MGGLAAGRGLRERRLHVAGRSLRRPVHLTLAVVWLEARAISAAHETSTFVAFLAVVMWRLLLTTLLFAVYMLFLAAVMGMVPGTLGPGAP